MPGPVSDSYDPEFGTGARAAEVMEAVQEVRKIVSAYIDSEKLKDIVELSEGYNTTRNEYAARVGCQFSERELRIIRFCLDRALESI
jgi:hypothetical protein